MGGIKITQADKWFSLVSIREAYDWTCCRCGTSTITTIRDWIAVMGIPEGIGPLDSRPSMHGQPVWVATVLRAVTGSGAVTNGLGARETARATG